MRPATERGMRGMEGHPSVPPLVPRTSDHSCRGHPAYVRPPVPSTNDRSCLTGLWYSKGWTSFGHG
jgi:hypothetical protein